MKDSVPDLMAKIIQGRSRIVCFVGKGIWLIIEAAMKKQILEFSGVPTGGFSLIPRSIKKEEDLLDIKKEADPIDIKKEDDLLDSKNEVLTVKSPSRKSSGKKQSVQFDWGLQPYKFVYPALGDVRVR